MDPSYNNSFGSFGSSGGQTPQSIMSPVGNGDIVFSSTQPVKKKKTGLIIGVFLIVTLAIVGVLVGFIFANNKGGYQGFVDLVLYGEKKDYPNEYGAYAIQRAATDLDEEALKVYFSKIQDKGTALLASVNESEKDTIKKILFWTYVVNFYYYFDSTTVDIYEANGYDNAKKVLEEKYDVVSIDSNKEYLELVSLSLDAELLYLDYVSEYEAGGCLLTKEVDDCVAVDPKTSLSEIENQYVAIYDNAREMIKDVVVDLAKGSSK